MNYSKSAIESLYNNVRRQQVASTRHLRTGNKTLNEEVDINITGNRSGSFSLTKTYYDEVLKPVLDMSSKEDSILALFERGVDCGFFESGESPTNDDNISILKYIEDSTDLNQFTERLQDKSFMKRVGDIFITKLEQGTTFNFYDLLNSVYDGNFTYNEFFIKEAKPHSFRAATRGAPGPGEIFLSFLFNGSKPDVGDVVINGKAIELKLNGGRIGKSVDEKRAGPMHAKYRKASTAEREAMIDQAEQNNGVATVEDFLFGTDTWPGISGVLSDPGLKDDFLKQPAREILKINDELLTQLTGVIHLKDYIHKIQKFDILQVFEIGGNTVGITFEDINNANCFELIERLNSMLVMFKYKTSGGSAFDASGMQIDIRKATRQAKNSIRSVSASLASINKLSQSESELEDLLNTF